MRDALGGLCGDPPADLSAALACIAQFQRVAASAGTALRAPPPEPVGCCGRGCQGCVWEGYYAALAFWREDALLTLQAAGPRTIRS